MGNSQTRRHHLWEAPISFTRDCNILRSILVAPVGMDAAVSFGGAAWGHQFGEHDHLMKGLVFRGTSRAAFIEASKASGSMTSASRCELLTSAHQLSFI